jgi:hypothetical protein
VARATAHNMTKTPPRVINLPEGDHDEVMGEMGPMVHAWSKVVVGFDNMIVQQYGEDAGRAMVDVVSTLAYAHVAKAAWALASAASAADMHPSDFDPVEFGKRCEAIAREQIERYRTAYETAGTA